jgi:Rrf2 family protein
MKFSTRATYGLKAMLHLAERYGEGAVPVSQISGDEKISAAYLEQILSRIKREGWVKSVRGPRGGYVLTAKPSEITVGALLRALGEDVLVRPNAAPRPAGSKKARAVPQAAAELFWERLSGAFAAALDRVSLEELIQSVRPESGAHAGAQPIHFNI